MSLILLPLTKTTHLEGEILQIKFMFSGHIICCHLTTENIPNIAIHFDLFSRPVSLTSVMTEALGGVDTLFIMKYHSLGADAAFLAGVVETGKMIIVASLYTLCSTGYPTLTRRAN